MEIGAKAGGLLMGGEIRTFDRDHLQEAWDWIKSHPRPTHSIPTKRHIAEMSCKYGIQQH